MEKLSVQAILNDNLKFYVLFRSGLQTRSGVECAVESDEGRRGRNNL